ncbi:MULTISPECIES: hypothetical protein [Serratia]|uniref:hypothetical protein n=1 Tax=Serratia TaxID=613 RepID=UPI002177B18A|nr:hypothetical protein [Serratia liquefaciens]CAI1792191.1 Uncharacterised protein [Serratia liquefaciens]
MRSVMVVQPGGDLNKLLLPGRYQLIGKSTYQNYPAIAAGKGGFLDVSYMADDARQIFQEFTFRDGNQPRLLTRFINSDSAMPYPSGTFIFQSWYQIGTTLVT